MSRIQRIRKGADIRLEGRPADTVSEAPSAHVYAVKPPDFIGVVTKLAVRVGDNVKAGSTLFYDKKMPSVKYSSPVAGTIKDIVRGAKDAFWQSKSKRIARIHIAILVFWTFRSPIVTRYCRVFSKVECFHSFANDLLT